MPLPFALPLSLTLSPLPFLPSFRTFFLTSCLAYLALSLSLSLSLRNFLMAVGEEDINACSSPAAAGMAGGLEPFLTKYRTDRA